MAKKETTELMDLTDLNDKFGDAIISGDFLKDHDGKKISTGLLSFDIAFNGGIKEGNIVHVGGLTGSGKTTWALTFAAQAQKDGRTVYYADVEGRLQPELLACIPGLDMSRLRIIRSTAEKFLNAEDYLMIIEQIIKDDPGAVIIIDSLAALCPEIEMASDMTEQQRATLPKLMYKFLRKMAQIIPVNKNILISLTHMQANPSGYGSPFREVGGNGIQYFASYWMSCISVTKVLDKEKKIGQDSKFKIAKVAGGPPDGEPIAFIRYGRGCDRYIDIATIGLELGTIVKAGAWYEIQLDSFKDENKKYPKLQGEKNLAEWLSVDGRGDLLENYIRGIVFGDK